MKKVLVAVVFISLSLSAFAADFSIGAGGSIGFLTWQDIKGMDSGTSAEVVERGIPIDIKVFADITVFQLSVGYMFVTSASQTITTAAGGTATATLSSFASYLTFAAYGKYPFTFGPISIFPLLGVEYRYNLTWSVGSTTKDSLTAAEQTSLNEFWIRGGAGMDVTFGKLYLRTEVLLGFKPILGTYDSDNMQLAQTAGWTDVSTSYFTVTAELLAGFKL